MAEIFGVKGYDGVGWNIDITSTDRVGFNAANFGESISVGTFQDSTHKTDSTMSTDLCSPDHIRNCKYISPTEVSLMGGAAVTLDTTNVGQNDCTLQWSYQDDTVNTALSNVRFFFYDAVDPANAPAGVIAVAFEHDGAAINKDRVSDTPGDGGAWDSSKGIGGNANALICSDQASASIHNFYIGISLSPTSKGLKTAVRARLEFDAQ
ncbi:MAG: hypothetical protein GXP46_01985 [Deferribacteres bacterium]|nr:hypothetical protein [Deferribacteres bacterium]